MNKTAGELGRRQVRRTRWGAAGAGLILALAAVPVVLPGLSGAARADSCDWPMFGQGLSRTAASTCSEIGQSNVSTLRPAWFFPTPDNSAITATPTVGPDGMVYAGDDNGDFFAVQPGTGVATAKWTFNIHAQPQSGSTCLPDGHHTSYGEITSSAALDPTSQVVVFGGGGTLYALNTSNGYCEWSQDVDPNHASGPMEIESSPAIVQLSGKPVVIVGSDNNEDSHTDVAPGGVQAFDLSTGELLWKFEPYGQKTILGPSWPTIAEDGVNNGCSDVWSSPAVDPTALGGQGLVVFGQGNCPGRNAGPNPGQVDGTMAVNATTGAFVWDYQEPFNAYTNTQYPDNGDTDFGSSPIITTNGAVVEGGKSGYVYVLNETTGQQIWATQAAQPGELGVGPGAIGGFIGSGALGEADPPVGSSSPNTFFGANAVESPLNGNGLFPLTQGNVTGLTGSIDTTMACGLEKGSVPDPQCLRRTASLHAVDADTGKVLWQAPISLPTYGSVTYSNRVVFAPSTTGFSIHAYDADTGTQLWSYPLGATVASGTAISGSSIYLGTGIAEGATVPGANGIWSFTSTP